MRMNDFLRVSVVLASVMLFLVSCGETDDVRDTAEREFPSDSSAGLPEIAIDTATNLDTVLADTSAPELSSSLLLSPAKIRLTETGHLLREKEFSLELPEGFAIVPAAEGMKRVRFMAFSPDHRLFVTDMYNLADNVHGKIYVLDGFDEQTKKFARRTVYLENLRNPNSVAFFTDESGMHWIYVAMTDRLVRWPYVAGDMAPSGQPDTLLTFPDSGNSYRDGGWHLTRTVTFGSNGKMYVSVGSSCNVCEEKEDLRACILEMNPDGSEQHIYADGLRNAVGIRWADGALWATNMGADHLGMDEPEDNFYRVRGGANYGWPYVYEYNGRVHLDPVYGSQLKAPSPEDIPLAWSGLDAHVAPLGFDWFGDAADTALQDHFLIALHGSGSVAMRRGYSIVRVSEGNSGEEFIGGFLKGKKRYGRPCDILRAGSDAFFFTDDYAGVLYYVWRRDQEKASSGTEK